MIDNSQDEEFVYDLLGNRTSVELRDNTTVSYTHNSVNGYIDIGGCDPDVAHDDKGNLTRDHRGYEYQYDVDNRLMYVYNDVNTDGDYDYPGDTLYAQYEYDAMGRRIYSKIASAEKKYIYDGQRVIVETDGDGDFEQKFVFGNYIDEVLIMDDGTNDYYYGHDHLYSVVALFDDSGSVVERYEYDAYGAVQVMDASYTNRTTSSYDNPYTFTGRRLDELTSNLVIMYYRARYYDPEVGSFMQMDPLGVDPLDSKINSFWPLKQYTDGMNLYGYVRGRPVNYNDPDGKLGFPSSILFPQHWFTTCGLTLYCRINYLIGGSLDHCEVVRQYPQGTKDTEKLDMEAERARLYAVIVDRSPNRKIRHGRHAGTPCSCATCGQIRDCENRAGNFNADGAYTPWNNCQTSAARALGKCCLKTTWRPQSIARLTECVETKMICSSVGACVRTCVRYSFSF